MKHLHRITLAFCVLAFAALLVLAWRAGIFTSGPDKAPAIDPRVAATTALRAARESKTAVDSRTGLADLKKALRRMETREAVAWILQQLEQGADFPTQLEFTIGTGQTLTAWPTYRVFLLDMLMLVDPGAAAVKAREILQTMTSADEWAVALRNLARDNADAVDAALLKQKSAELLHNIDWRAKPSAGYLQAFDVIVHTASTDLVPDLVSLCDDRDQQAVRHAAFLTLDRLTLKQPERVLPMLGQYASSHPQSGLMISNMIARGDLRDETQRKAVESYLLDERRTAEELRGFASVFPNANIAVSDNLLTRGAAINGAELAAQDRATLETIATWLGDPAFSRSHAMLLKTYQRLKGFVGP